MMSRTESNAYWAMFEREAEAKDPTGLDRQRDDLRSQQKMVQKTIKMLMDGIADWEKKNDELEAAIDAIDEQKDQAWDAWFAARKAVGR